MIHIMVNIKKLSQKAHLRLNHIPSLFLATDIMMKMQVKHCLKLGLLLKMNLAPLQHNAGVLLMTRIVVVNNITFLNVKRVPD